ncbi:MAG: glycosyltransferase [Melioribacteraceae bacterium]|nr:glycosyltransferase [Melioribacteraceae bacterium]
MKKILHIAPLNFAGVPYDFFRMHNHVGDFSHLITLHKNPHTFPEDICLDFPLPKFSLAKFWRDRKKKEIDNSNSESAPYFKSKNVFEKIYFAVNDSLRTQKVEEAIKKYELDSFDIIHLDGGLGFYRNSKQIQKWKSEGKKIVSCFYGSDLRSRGLIKEIDEISDLNITSEYDHLLLKNDLEYLFYPYDTAELPARIENNSDLIKIVHSPTNRKYKGTELIISVINEIKKKYKIEFHLLENLSREEVLRVKSTCDICIDQVGGLGGGTGYGKSGLETLGMGIPTIINMIPEYIEWMPENPFVIANNFDELKKALVELIDDPQLRQEYSAKGTQWVKKYHGYESVNKSLYDLYKKYRII